jgi:hypothetical protein
MIFRTLAQGVLMSTRKLLRTSLIVMFGVIMAMMTFAGPAKADSVYPPPPGTQVLGSTSSGVPVAGVSTATTTYTGLASTGTNAIGIGALGGLLLVGGGALVLVGKGRKADS